MVRADELTCAFAYSLMSESRISGLWGPSLPTSPMLPASRTIAVSIMPAVTACAMGCSSLWRCVRQVSPPARRRCASPLVTSFIPASCSLAAGPGPVAHPPLARLATPQSQLPARTAAARPKRWWWGRLPQPPRPPHAAAACYPATAAAVAAAAAAGAPRPPGPPPLQNSTPWRRGTCVRSSGARRTMPRRW